MMKLLMINETGINILPLIKCAYAEPAQIAEVRDRYAERVALVPRLPEERVGSSGLYALMQSTKASEKTAA